MQGKEVLKVESEKVGTGCDGTVLAGESKPQCRLTLAQKEMTLNVVLYSTWETEEGGQEAQDY